jgi:hypothetical protein
MGKIFNSEKYNMMFCPIVREKVKYPKTLMTLVFAQDVEAAG